MYNPYNNIYLNSGNKLYQPPELVLNPLAKNVPKREINLGFNLWGPNLPSVVKLYDPLNGNVKGVIDTSNPNSIMTLEEYQNRPMPMMPQLPFQNYTNPLFSTEISKNPPFNRLSEITIKTPSSTKENELIDMVYDKPIDSTGTVSEWTITNNPFVYSKSILLNKSGEKFSGSGILLIEYVNDKRYLTLVKSKRGLYEDLGGEISKSLIINNQTLENNAIKEALEESKGLIYIKSELAKQNNSIYNYVDVEDENGFKYRCYVIVIQNDKDVNLPQLYNKNKYNIGVFSGADWNETYELVRLDLKNIITQIYNLKITDNNKIKNDMFVEQNGQQTGIKIRCRTVKILDKILGEKTGSVKDPFDLKPIKSYIGNKTSIEKFECNQNNIYYITL